MCDCVVGASPPFYFSADHIFRYPWVPNKSTYNYQFKRNLVCRASRKASTSTSSSIDDLNSKEKSNGIIDLNSKQTDSILSAIGEQSGNATGNGDSTEKSSLLKVTGSRSVLKKGRQVIKRSSLIAKQVISVQSALSLGFVSQLWVDTSTLAVLVVEVRPNLLSGEAERFILDDVSKVGDVMLVEDESVVENEIKMIGLETLVGYRVETPRRGNIGKVRGYSFNINSGALEMLELDSFGVSFIPSSMVSTYGLHVDDILEVFPDTIVVHEAAASRMQRLTKGFLDSNNVGVSMEDLEEFTDPEIPTTKSTRNKNKRRSFNQEKVNTRIREIEDDLDLPMDYL